MRLPIFKIISLDKIPNTYCTSNNKPFYLINSCLEVSTVRSAPFLNLSIPPTLAHKLTSLQKPILFFISLAYIFFNSGLITYYIFLDGPPVMLTGSSTGHVAVWNLEERKLSSQMRHAHSGEHGGVAGLCCLPSEPLMITSSGDNTVKMWIFDMPDGGARLLRHREGEIILPLLVRTEGYI